MPAKAKTAVKKKVTRKKSSTKRTRKPTVKKREANIVTKPKQDGSILCPRCGAGSEDFILRYTSTSGRKQYTCMSEACRAVRSKGRGFVVFANGMTYPRTK